MRAYPNASAEADRKPRIAVIGLGAQGLVTVKNLLEVGFNVVGFDKNLYVGGIWHYSAEAKLSALPSTIVNVSKERACFTDFPFPDASPSFPDAEMMDKYLNAYADEFQLWPHLRLGTEVKVVRRDDERDLWVTEISSAPGSNIEHLEFEKLVIAAGPHDRPVYPDIENRQAFTGTIKHAVSFKNADEYENKRVLVIGASNSAADTCTSLADSALMVYFAHRYGAIVLPRILRDGSSLDHKVTYRNGMASDWLDSQSLELSQWLAGLYVGSITRSEYGRLDPDWRITPAPSLLNQVPTISDTLIPSLRQGRIISCQVPIRFVGGHSVELADGEIVDVDTIICCTGYAPNLSFLGSANPMLHGDGPYDDAAPRLYQNIFSLRYPNSLAFIGYADMSQPALLRSDLASMAVAQLWSNRASSPSLPSPGEMEEWYRQHLSWIAQVRRLSPQGKIVKFSVRSGLWIKWIDRVIDARIDEHLGYVNMQAWKFWLIDHNLCNLLMGGIWSPHLYKLFDGAGRKKWVGARDAIERANYTAKNRNRKRF